MTLEMKDYTSSHVYPASFNGSSIIVSMNDDNDYIISILGLTYQAHDKLAVIQIILGQEQKGFLSNKNTDTNANEYDDSAFTK